MVELMKGLHILHFLHVRLTGTVRNHIRQSTVISHNIALTSYLICLTQKYTRLEDIRPDKIKRKTGCTPYKGQNNILSLPK